MSDTPNKRDSDRNQNPLVFPVTPARFELSEANIRKPLQTQQSQPIINNRRDLPASPCSQFVTSSHLISHRHVNVRSTRASSSSRVPYPAARPFAEMQSPRSRLRTNAVGCGGALRTALSRGGWGGFGSRDCSMISHHGASTRAVSRARIGGSPVTRTSAS